MAKQPNPEPAVLLVGESYLRSPMCSLRDRDIGVQVIYGFDPCGVPSENFSQKISLTEEQVAAAEKTLEANGTTLVPVVVDGDVVPERVSLAWTDSYKLKHTEEKS